MTAANGKSAQLAGMIARYPNAWIAFAIGWNHFCKWRNAAMFDR